MLVALVIIIANTIIIALACIALYAIKKWKYWQEKWKSLTKLILLCLFVSFSSCSTKFTTTHTRINLYEFADTLDWRVKGNKIFLDDHGKKYVIDNSNNVYTVDSCDISYKIEEVNVTVRHW